MTLATLAHVPTVTPQTDVYAPSDGFQVTATGLLVTGKPSYEQWHDFMLQLADKYNKLKWLISDALAWGESTYGDDIYQLASEYWQPHTIDNYVSTARRIPMAERRADVVFSIHSETTSLSPEHRKYALAMVASKQWNRQDLRDWKQTLKTGETPMDSEQLITLRATDIVYKADKIVVVFDKPSGDIVEFKAIVRKKAIA